MRYVVHLDGRTFRVEVSPNGLLVDGDPVEAELAPRTGSPVRSARVEGRSIRVLPRSEGAGRWSLDVNGVVHAVEVVDPAEEALREAQGAHAPDTGHAPLRAPMPGLVVKVEVAPGDDVREGSGLVIVEAMKMENELRAIGEGRVKEVLVTEGEAVERDQLLVVFEASEPSDGEGG